MIRFRSRTLRRVLQAGAILSLFATTSEAAPWSRAFVVEWSEPAFHYGGPEGGNEETIGTDCPNGTNPELDIRKLLLAAGYNNVDELMNIDNLARGRERPWVKALQFRGPNKEDIYKNPESWPDPGSIPVTGMLAEGFDLDDNPNTGFVGVNGEKGIDNAWYKVGGCTTRWRGPPRTAYSHKYYNETMYDGAYTIVIVLSGNESPLNDTDARLGFYTSKDKVVKDSAGLIARDYTFKIDPDPRFQSIMKIRIANGVAETVGRPDIRMHDYMSDLRTTAKGALNLYRGKLRFELKADGTLHGLVAGYRPWIDHYEMFNNSTRERIGRVNAPAAWYSLKRNADAMPDPKTGQNTAISTAYRIDALPAFVITPDAAAEVKVATEFGASTR